MKKILVPIDFSEDTTLVCRYALELGRHESSMICLMHSYFDRMTISETSFPSSIETETYINEQLLRETYDQARERILHLQDTILRIAEDEDIGQIEVDTHLEGGEPISGIIEYCGNFDPDIIVMGTSGRGRKGFMEGSVSRKIMNNADIPVMAIPSMPAFRPLQNILYLTNFDQGDARCIHALMDILRPYNTRTFVLHLLNEQKQEETSHMLDQLRSHFLEEEDKGLIQFIMQPRTDYRQDVLEFTREHAIDTISFIPHKRNFLDGFFRKVMTKKDLYDANIPLLAIPGRERCSS